MRLFFAPGLSVELRERVLAAVPEAVESDDPDVVVAGDVSQAPERPDRTLMLCDISDTARLAELWASRRLPHLMLPTSPSVELAGTLRRMANVPASGCADLIGPSEFRHAWSIHDTDAKQGLLENLSLRAQMAGLTRRGAQRLMSIAEELVSNALYNAPVDEAGRRLHAHKSRSERVTLDKGSVGVELAADEDRVALVVKDVFGTLSAETAFENLARCLRGGEDQIAEKQGGAGLGLYTVLLASNYLGVTVKPRRTEIVAIVDKRPSRPAGRCFNWYAGLAAS